MVNYFDGLKPRADPVVLCSHIKQKRNTLERECWTILNKPKAKVEPSAKQRQQKQPQPPSPPTENSNQQSSEQQPSMEVD